MGNESQSKVKPTGERTPPPNDESENEGEGNRSADRRYREHVSRHVKSGRSEKAAQDARRAVEGEEADDLRAAEQTGKSRARAFDDDVERDPDADDEQAKRERD